MVHRSATFKITILVQDPKTQTFESIEAQFLTVDNSKAVHNHAAEKRKLPPDNKDSGEYKRHRSNSYISLNLTLSYSRSSSQRSHCESSRSQSSYHLSARPLYINATKPINQPNFTRVKCYEILLHRPSINYSN